MMPLPAHRRRLLAPSAASCFYKAPLPRRGAAKALFILLALYLLQRVCDDAPLPYYAAITVVAARRYYGLSVSCFTGG